VLKLILMKKTFSILLFLGVLLSLNSCIITKTASAAVSVAKTAVTTTGTVAKAGVNAIDGNDDKEEEEENNEGY